MTAKEDKERKEKMLSGMNLKHKAESVNQQDFYQQYKDANMERRRTNKRVYKDEAKVRILEAKDLPH